MMVRFSDIIKIKDKKEQKVRTPVSKPEKEDRVRLSDSQIFKKKKESIPPDDKILSEDESLEIITYYEKFIERAIEIQERVKNDKGISPSPILSDLHYIIDKNLIDDLYEYALSSSDDYEEIIIHTIDVTFVALLMGKGLEYDTTMLLRLGLAAFLENVGMYKIPDSILKRKGRLGEEELKVIRKHPEISAEILGRMGEKYSWLAEVASQVHERSDGSGYPRGLKGEEISELASIIGLIDTYVAMIKRRSYRERFVQTDAVKFILKAGKSLFPVKIVKTFLTEISLFPVNTYVRLNNKSIGRVISTDKNQPLKPKIELLYDSQGKNIEKKTIIRLSDNPLLYIVNSVDAEEIP